MLNKLSTIFILGSVTMVFLLGGCGDDSHSPGVPEVIPEGAFIDDQIILEMSEAVEGIIGPEEMLFDLTGIQMVQEGSFNDLEISYWSANSCDQDAWVYDYRSRSWKQIGFDNAPDVGCWTVPVEQFHILSAAGINATDALDGNQRLRLRIYYPPTALAQENKSSDNEYTPTVRALRLNPNYHAVSLVGSEPRHCYGLAFDGEALWVSERRKLLRLSVKGDVLVQHCAPGDWPVGLGFDGRSVLVGDRENQLSKVTLDGYGFGRSPLPTGFVGGLTCGPHRTWAGDRIGPEFRIFGQEDTVYCGPIGPCEYAVPDTLAAPGGACRGLAWDGEHLLVASDSLYVIAISGEVLAAYSLPVAEVRDIAWDGESVWMVNRGPIDLPSRDQVVTRFRLR